MVRRGTSWYKWRRSQSSATEVCSCAYAKPFTVSSTTSLNRCRMTKAAAEQIVIGSYVDQLEAYHANHKQDKACGYKQPYKASLTREQFLFYKMRTTAKLVCEGLDDEQVIAHVVSENLFHKNPMRQSAFPGIEGGCSIASFHGLENGARRYVSGLGKVDKTGSMA